MKYWGSLALALFCLAGFIAWMFRLQSGEPITWYSVLFTAASAAGIIMFTTSARENRK